MTATVAYDRLAASVAARRATRSRSSSICRQWRTARQCTSQVRQERRANQGRTAASVRARISASSSLLLRTFARPFSALQTVSML